MKYSKGDKVRIRNIGWYEEMLSIPSKVIWPNNLAEDFIGIWCGSHVFRKEMCDFCGMVMTIREVGIDFYLMEEDKMGYEFTDEMIAGEDVSWMYDGNLVAERFSDGDKEVPKFKVGDKIVKVGGLSNGCLVMSVSDEYYGLQMGEGNVGVLPVAEQDEWILLSEGDKKIEGLVEEEMPLDKSGQITDFEYEGLAYTLPEGYQFVDENGNVIETKKIVLEKKKKEYPKTLKECRRLLDIDSGFLLASYDLDFWKGHLLTSLQKLLICRDAYWKIAGEEMGLGKPWEPDWKDDHQRKYTIYTMGNEVIRHYGGYIHSILAFPTEEMRDAFYEAFKDLIEECKELL